MTKRIFDIAFAISLLVLSSPLWLLAAIGIRFTSSGPIFYSAPRIGKHGVPFVMYKFRTMHANRVTAGGSITAARDHRVFPVGNVLRRLKIDELPQLLNILMGQMSVCGPRPEAPDIAQNHYQPWHMASLTVRPGLTSPGSLYYYTHGEQHLNGDNNGDDNTEQAYVQQLLPIKLAIDIVSLANRTITSDLKTIVQTVWVIVSRAAGRTKFPCPVELAAAEQLVSEQAHRVKAA